MNLLMKMTAKTRTISQLKNFSNGLDVLECI